MVVSPRFFSVIWCPLGLKEFLPLLAVISRVSKDCVLSLGDLVLKHAGLPFHLLLCFFFFGSRAFPQFSAIAVWPSFPVPSQDERVFFARDFLLSGCAGDAAFFPPVFLESLTRDPLNPVCPSCWMPGTALVGGSTRLSTIL